MFGLRLTVRPLGVLLLSAVLGAGSASLAPVLCRGTSREDADSSVCLPLCLWLSACTQVSCVGAPGAGCECPHRQGCAGPGPPCQPVPAGTDRQRGAAQVGRGTVLAAHNLSHPRTHMARHCRVQGGRSQGCVCVCSGEAVAACCATRRVSELCVPQVAFAGSRWYLT